jgi:hypothetical protein
MEVIVGALNPFLISGIEQELDRHPSEPLHEKLNFQDAGLRMLLSLLNTESEVGGPFGRLYADSLIHALGTRFIRLGRAIGPPDKSIKPVLFPEGKLTIGPPVEKGCYYDFDLPRGLPPQGRKQPARSSILKGRLPFQVNQCTTTWTSSRSKPINFSGGLAEYSFLLIFGQVGDTALNYIHPALIRTAEQYHRPIRPKNDSFGSKGCQSNLQVGIEIRFCPGLPTCFRNQTRKLAKDIFPSRQLRKVLSPWGYHSLPYPGLRNVIENKHLVGMAVNKLNRLRQMTFKY